MNQWNMEPFWTVDYVVRDDFVVNLAQRYFVTPRGHSTPIFETWGLAGLNAGRSETTSASRTSSDAARAPIESGRGPG